MARGRKLHRCSVHRWCTRVCHDWRNPLEPIPEEADEFVPSLQVKLPSQDDDQKPSKGIKLVISLKKLNQISSAAAANNNHGNKKRKSILSHYSEKYTYAKLNRISLDHKWPRHPQSAAAATAA